MENTVSGRRGKSTRDPLGLTGQVLDEKIRIDEPIGVGGFSVVYRGSHLVWKQTVAVKAFQVVKGMPAEDRKKLVEGFVREGQVLSKLSSRTTSIVQARDIGAAVMKDGDWVPYMVLEWLEGIPLDKLIARDRDKGTDPLSLDEAFEMLTPAAEALELAHREGIVHCDLKPANLFLVDGVGSQGPVMKVLDFGIAKIMAGGWRSKESGRAEGASSFTPNYAAPEQFSKKHGSTGPWTDVFAMALVLLELAIGRPALDGNDVLQLAIASRDPDHRPTPRGLGLQVPDPVERAFARALAVEPADRPQTMGAFWKELQQAINEVDAPVHTTAAPARRSSLVGVGAAAVGLAVGIAFYASSDREPDPAASSTVAGSESAPTPSCGAQSVALSMDGMSVCVDKALATTADYRICSDKGECQRPRKKDQVTPPAETDCAFWANDGTAPVNCITFDMAEDYCQHVGKRLPTATEVQDAFPEERKALTNQTWTQDRQLASVGGANAKPGEPASAYIDVGVLCVTTLASSQ